MRKCILLFTLLIVAILLFKVSATSTDETNAKELVSLSDKSEIAKN